MKAYNLATRNMKEIYRDPVSMLLGIAMPVGFLLLFSSIYKKSHLEIFSPQMLTSGVIIFSFAFLIMFSAILLAKDKQNAFLVRLFTTPLKSSDFIISYLLPFLPLAFAQIAVCLTTGILLGATFNNLLLTLVIYFMTALMCISLGMILGALFTVNQVSGIGSIIITAVSIFSGAWMDLKMIGGIFEKTGYALPFAHAIDISRGLQLRVPFSSLLHSFYIVILYTIVFFILAILSFRRAMKRI
jgi:ABC-2 type transport system permease protein